jgi:hypothetical protein
MLTDECNGKLQVDFLMPAPAFIAVAAHQNHPAGGGDQRGKIARLRLKSPRLRRLPPRFGRTRTRFATASRGCRRILAFQGPLRQGTLMHLRRRCLVDRQNCRNCGCGLPLLPGS